METVAAQLRGHQGSPGGHVEPTIAAPRVGSLTWCLGRRIGIFSCLHDGRVQKMFIFGGIL